MPLVVLLGLLVPGLALSLPPCRPSLSGHAWRHPPPSCSYLPNSPPRAPPDARRGYGGGGDDGVLRQIATDMLHALAAVWSIQRSHEGAEESALTLRRMAAWHGDQRHHDGLVKGMLKGRSMGAYFGESLEAVIMLRYERDLSSLQRAVEARHVLVVEAVAIAPSVPGHIQPALEGWILRSLLEYGALHSMRVSFARSFGEDPPWGV